MNIVIADDHGLFKDGLRIQLRRICPAAEVSEADTFAQVRAILDRCRPDYVVLDLMMPGGHWRQELPEVIDRARPGRCVVLSAVEDPAEIADAMAMGIAGFIPKRSDPKIVAHALGLIFDGGVYVPPEYMAGVAAVASPSAAGAIACRLTPRQKDVLRRMCAGCSNKQIAFELSMSEATVKQHVNAILRQLGAHNRTGASMAAQRLGLLPPA